MTYDGFGRQQRWIFPSRTSPGIADQADFEEYAYDGSSNRIAMRKRDGSVLTFQYDALKRMTAKIVPERSGLAAAQTRDVYYEYDLRGLQTKARFDGLAGEGVTTQYDGFGRVTSSTLAMSGTSRTLGHLYDREGNRIRTTHPDGVFMAYEYDGLSRLVRVREIGTDILAGFSYDAAGRRSGLTSGGTSSRYAYDPPGRLNRLEHDLADTSADQVVGLAYNPASQIRSRSGSNDGYAWTGTAAVSRDYAANGQNQYTGTASNGSASATFAYDPNGNLVSTVNPPWSTTYVYDVENRLVSASGTETAALVYDPLGRLFQVSSPAAGTIRFLHDDDALIGECDSAGNMLRRYVHGSDKGVDDPLIWYEYPASGWRRALVADQQGSIVAVADMFGNRVAINTYDEYGIRGPSNQGRFQYTGQAWIPELGLYYYKARFYSPTLGRFLQVDPIGYDDQINLYAYVANDPVNANDPTGEVISVVVRGILWAGQKCIGNATCRGVVQRAGQAAKRGVDRITRRDRPEPPRRQPPNPHGSKGKPDHQEEVARQREIAREQAGPGETVLQERKARGMDVNRLPDVQTRDSSGRTVRVREVERQPDSKRVQDKRADYERNGIHCDVVDCNGKPR